MEWISVKDRLPDRDGNYLCCFQTGYIYTEMYDNNGFYDYEPEFISTEYEKIYHNNIVTHWMPLPEPPKE